MAESNPCAGSGALPVLGRCPVCAMPCKDALRVPEHPVPTRRELPSNRSTARWSNDG